MNNDLLELLTKEQIMQAIQNYMTDTEYNDFMEYLHSEYFED